MYTNYIHVLHAWLCSCMGWYNSSTDTNCILFVYAYTCSLLHVSPDLLTLASKVSLCAAVKQHSIHLHYLVLYQDDVLSHFA